MSDGTVTIHEQVQDLIASIDAQIAYYADPDAPAGRWRLAVVDDDGRVPTPTPVRLAEVIQFPQRR